MRRRIVLLLPNWVGDAVMATPAIRALRETFADAELIGLGRGYVRAVFDGNPWLDEFLVLPGGLISPLVQAAALQRRDLDTAVLFTNSFRSALVARLAGCRRRIGFDRDGRTLLLTDRLYARRDECGRIRPAPIVLDYLRLAARAGAAIRSGRLELFATADDEAAADRTWERMQLGTRPEVVCLNPGAAFGSAKLWPIEHFAALARRFAMTREAGVLVLCGPAERELARAIANAARHPLVHSLANEAVSIGLTKACVRRCDLLVSTDSGPRHFAAAFNRPVVALFGPTHIAWTQTFHRREVQLQHRVPCGPCQLRTCPVDHRCMSGLHPDVVFRAGCELLERRAANVA